MSVAGLYPDWVERAACAGAKIADWAFGVAAQQHAFIARYCDDCPVKRQCRDYGRGWDGVYGGRSSAGRETSKVAKQAACGTVTGYRRHNRLRELPCDPCRTANAESARRQYNAAGGKLPPTPTGRCGTYPGYQRHWARGEFACEPCMDAQRAYAQGRKALRRAR